MLRIYAVVKEIDSVTMHFFDFLSFYLRRADAEADMKDRNEKGVKVVPVEVNETYEPDDE